MQRWAVKDGVLIAWIPDAEDTRFNPDSRWSTGIVSDDDVLQFPPPTQTVVLDETKGNQ